MSRRLHLWAACLIGALYVLSFFLPVVDFRVGRRHITANGWDAFWMIALRVSDKDVN